MQKFNKLKQSILLMILMMTSTWCVASNLDMADGYSSIPVKEAGVQGAPKGSSIQAYIDGHVLSVTFTENLGEVTVEITTSTGGYVQVDSCLTPNGLQFYIPLAGDYIITFTFPNGDEYYGEFTVTN